MSPRPNGDWTQHEADAFVAGVRLAISEIDTSRGTTSQSRRVNLACLDCGSPLRDDGHCDRCSSTYDDIVAKGPDPYDVAGGLDLRRLEDDRYAATCRARITEHEFALRGERPPWRRARTP